jgi:predicted  nucleic acid-binding Zn-ribbon protein
MEILEVILGAVIAGIATMIFYFGYKVGREQLQSKYDIMVDKYNDRVKDLERDKQKLSRENYELDSQIENLEERVVELSKQKEDRENQMLSTVKVRYYDGEGIGEKVIEHVDRVFFDRENKEMKLVTKNKEYFFIEVFYFTKEIEWEK